MSNVDLPDAVAASKPPETSVTEDNRTGRPVRVTWIDSGLSAAHGWTSRHDLPDGVETVETVGMWMGENADVVMVGGSRDAENEMWLAVQLVYKPCIRKVEWL